MKILDLPKKISVFPLSNFILFPKTTVPLNIFEPRYIDMINDSMKSDKLIGMIQPKISENIDEISSKISSFSSLRESLKTFQLNFKKIHSDKSGIVVDGRDITTVIFPDAEIKFYITASLKDRANRRFEELVLNNPKIDKKLVIKELQKRDQRDMERSTAPLKIAKDAIVIDTTDLTIEEVNSIVQREIEKVIK